MPTEIVVDADHFQILVGDSARGPLVDTSALWDSAASIPTVDGAPELIAVPIARFGGTVRVEVDVVAAPPEQESWPWESLGRFRLDVPSGEILLWGPELVDLATAARVKVPKGSYFGEARARDRDQVSDEQSSDGPDRYRLLLWPVQLVPAVR